MSAKTENQPALADQSQVFDDRPYLKGVRRAELVIHIGFGLAGALVLLAGLQLILSNSAFQEENPSVGYAVSALGAAWLCMSIFVWSQKIVEVKVDDVSASFRFGSGKIATRRWDTPGLVLELSHAVRGPSGDPVKVAGRIIRFRGLSSTVSPEIEAALVARARRLGLVVRRREETFAVRGPPSTLEVVSICQREDATESNLNH